MAAITFLCGLSSGASLALAQTQPPGTPPQTEPSSAALQSDSANATGTWLLSCTGRRGQTQQFTLQIRQDGSRLSGSITHGSRSRPISGSIQGYQISVASSGGRRSLSFSGTISGATMTGATSKGRSCSAARQ